MDPKSAQILDPKLKEAYDRVMGSSVPAPTTPIQPPPLAHTESKSEHSDIPKMPDHHEPIDPMMPKIHPETASASAPASDASPHTAAASTHDQPQPHANMSFSTAYVAPHDAKKSPVSGKILVIAGVFFLIVYSLFWMKWFGMAIPFLP